MAENIPLFSKEELKKFRYKCSHKLVVSLTVGAVYLLLVSLFFLNKAVKAGSQNPAFYLVFVTAGYLLLVILTAMIIRRSQSLNFSRFLRGCVKFENWDYKLEYVELRMPGPFSPRFLKYPIHLMILGKVLEQSKIPENAEAGRRMIAASAERDPSLESYREAPLEDLMKHHEAFLAEHPEMMQEWNGAESFHSLLVHYILPVTIIVVILSLIFKTCQPPPEEAGETKDTPAATTVQNQAKPVREAVESAAKDAAETTGEKGADAPLTPPQV
ncbi:MAG: hypothetical protein PUC15_00755 [Lentisphaeria bacterium]|nr:hypothetical protein [Lentisphaeria bacterium]